MHRAPRYVQVYNQLLSMIKNGSFAPGAKLPSEESMSNDFNVSRVTLRTALSLLKEDNVIKSIHGQGHYVTEKQESNSGGIELIENPLRGSVSLKLDSCEAYFHKNTASTFTDKLFSVKDSKYLTLNLWYKNKLKNVANELSIILPETIEKFGIDIEDPTNLVQLLEKDIYSFTASSEVTIVLSERPVETFKRKFIDSGPLMLLTEDLFASNGDRIIQNKFYIPAKYFRATLRRYSNHM
ncbi:GntR family transcriptional regulator [Paucilactobacillus wasatchensis]|uniref:Transcriptional regulator n=1 Tax=Paucilactobacillus wasatchensis TaxID=1335616 RepID=A0A0D1ACC0_9LACO|nr:winged helix-turn-helix domain-containing protein [Paucilactobacillus wasatchensis]KIS04321.1 Transcriptional regulator [Paucilactobacillus wasatchensis]